LSAVVFDLRPSSGDTPLSFRFQRGNLPQAQPLNGTIDTGRHFLSNTDRFGRSTDMPAKSKAQQKAAGAALAAKRGEVKKSSLQGASKSMEKSMTEKELDELASTKRKGLPEKKSD
jgi:hypothetical protein